MVSKTLYYLCTKQNETEVNTTEKLSLAPRGGVMVNKVLWVTVPGEQGVRSSPSTHIYNLVPNCSELCQPLVNLGEW